MGLQNGNPDLIHFGRKLHVCRDLNKTFLSYYIGERDKPGKIPESIWNALETTL